MSIAWDALSQRERELILEFARYPTADPHREVNALILVEEWKTSLGDREIDEAEAACHDAQSRYLRALHGGSRPDANASIEAVQAAAVAFAQILHTRFEGDVRRVDHPERAVAPVDEWEERLRQQPVLVRPRSEPCRLRRAPATHALVIGIRAPRTRGSS